MFINTKKFKHTWCSKFYFFWLKSRNLSDCELASEQLIPAISQSFIRLTFSNEARDARWWFSVHITRDSRHYAGWLSQPGSQSLFPSPRCRGLHTAHVSINTFCTPPFPSQTQKNVITEKIPRTSAFHVVTDHFVAEKRNKWWISRKTFIFLFHTISTSRSWNNPFNMSIYTKMIVKPKSISKLFFSWSLHCPAYISVAPLFTS